MIKLKKINIAKGSRNGGPYFNSLKNEDPSLDELKDFINNVHPDVLREVKFLSAMKNKINGRYKLTTQMKRGMNNWYKNKRILKQQFEIDKVKLNPLIEKLDKFYKYLIQHNIQKTDEISATDLYALKNYLDGLVKFHTISKNILNKINIIYKKYE